MTMFVRSWSRKSIATATVVVTIFAMTFASTSSVAQENPPPAAGVGAPAHMFAPANHRKKKQSFGERLKAKFEKKLQKVTGPKKAAPKRRAPARRAGPSPSEIE